MSEPGRRPSEGEEPAEAEANAAEAAETPALRPWVGRFLGPALAVLDPLLLVVPAALAATCAFMMPVATPPNAIVFGSGHVTVPQMVRAGLWLNLAAVGLVTGVAYLLGPLVLGLDVAG